MIRAAMVLAAGLALTGCEQRAPADVQASDGWARPTLAAQQSTAAYLKLVNRGGSDDRLMSVSAPPPAVASLHSTEFSGGIARMRPATAGLAVPAGETVRLAPGGAHVMIQQIPAPLGEGGSIRLTLQFDSGATRTVDVPIRASAPAEEF